jgi:hypothetical protein
MIYKQRDGKGKSGRETTNHFYLSKIIKEIYLFLRNNKIQHRKTITFRVYPSRIAYKNTK